jgi:hypothetical protein
LVGYPLYDPPHKVEERRLSPDKAEANFDYFMSVRQQRLSDFRSWMESKFGVRLTLDRNGVVALCDWTELYGDLLYENRNDLDSYFFYTEPWGGLYAGSNVVFDIATFVGGALIAQCPGLYWDENPFTANDAKLVCILKKDKGSGFQRPSITGFRSPLMSWDPFLEIGNYISSLILWRTLPNLIAQRKKMTKHRWREKIINQEIRSFDAKISEYKSKRNLPSGIAPGDLQ